MSGNKNTFFYYDELSESEKKVLRFIEKDPAVVIQYTIQQVAMMAGTSVSAVQRFTKSIGYSGYKDFRNAVIKRKELIDLNHQNSDQNLLHDMSDSFSYSIHRLQDIDENLIKELCNDICSASKIILLGRYRNKTVIDKLAMNLTDLGLTCISASDEISYEHILYVTDPGSCVIIFSSLGEIRDTAHFFQQLQHTAEKLWLITNNITPKMSKYVTRQITLPSVNMQAIYPISAQFIMMAFIEILTAYIADKKRSGD